MDSHSFRADGDESASLVDPRARVVILHAIPHPGERGMGVTTENALSFARFCITERAMRYLLRET